MNNWKEELEKLYHPYEGLYIAEVEDFIEELLLDERQIGRDDLLKELKEMGVIPPTLTANKEIK